MEIDLLIESLSLYSRAFLNTLLFYASPLHCTGARPESAIVHAGGKSLGVFLGSEYVLGIAVLRNIAMHCNPRRHSLSPLSVVIGEAQPSAQMGNAKRGQQL